LVNNLTAVCAVHFDANNAIHNKWFKINYMANFVQFFSGTPCTYMHNLWQHRMQL